MAKTMPGEAFVSLQLQLLGFLVHLEFLTYLDSIVPIAADSGNGNLSNSRNLDR